MQDHRLRDLAAGRHRIIGKGARQEAAILAVNKLLVECCTHPVRECAEHLSVEERRVQDSPSVVHRHVFIDAHLSGIAVNLDAAEIENEAIGGRAVDFVGLGRRVEPGRCPEYGFAQCRGIGIGKRSRRPVTRPGEPSEADRIVKVGGREDFAVGEPTSSGSMLSWGAAMGVSLSRNRTAARYAAPATAPANRLE